MDKTRIAALRKHPVMGKFLDPLELEYLDGRRYMITREFDYLADIPAPPYIIHVPVGFTTDFASIPQMFWNILPPTGEYGKAAVIHDCLYAGKCGPPVRHYSRAEADGIFRDAMLVLGVSEMTAQTMWAAVRCFGWRFFHGA